MLYVLLQGTKIGVFKSFVIFTGKSRGFFNKVADLQVLKKRLWHRYFPVNMGNFYKNNVFYKTPLVAASDDMTGSSF